MTSYVRFHDWRAAKTNLKRMKQPAKVPAETC
jgi:hypothetical protein